MWDLSKPDEQQCVATLSGHIRCVASVTALPDGRLASCSDDYTVRVWDLSKPEGQRCITVLEEHNGWVFSVTALADGRLASCSHDNTVKVWDLSKPEGLQCVMTIEAHDDQASSVTALPDGRLASCSDDRTVKVWDLVSPRDSSDHIGRSQTARCQSRHCPWAAGFPPADHTVKVWNLSKPDRQQCVATLSEDMVRSVTALVDGRLASCSDDNTVKVWDLPAAMYGNT